MALVRLEYGCESGRENDRDGEIVSCPNREPRPDLYVLGAERRELLRPFHSIL